jgi:hypothetical protein
MKKLFLILIFTFSINSVFADSPLTNSDFYKAYLDIPLVNKTSKSSGILTDEIFDYLNSNSNTVDKKIALINALKWNINGKNNATLYFKKLLLTHKEYTPSNFYYKGTAVELICYASLKSLDNYFDVKKAFLFSSQAAKRNPKSYTIAIINQLIKAQIDIDNDWCEVYSGMNNIKENKNLVVDFRKKASNIIFNYTDGYKENCTLWHSIRKIFNGI